MIYSMIRSTAKIVTIALFATALSATPLSTLHSDPLTTAYAATSSITQSTIQVMLNQNNITQDLQTQPVMIKGSVYLPLREISQKVGIHTYWNASQNTITLTYPKYLTELDVQKGTVKVNTKVKNLPQAIVTIKNITYVPARMIAEASGQQVSWNSKKKLIIFKSDITYDKANSKTATIWFSNQNNELYFSSSAFATPVLAGKLPKKLEHLARLQVYDVNTGGHVVEWLDNYGDPSINYDFYTAFVKDDKIVRQASVDYWQRYDDNVFQYKGNAVLVNKDTLEFLDSEGKITSTRNLSTLAGVPTNYSVVGISDHYLIVRPNHTGLLTLINLRNKSSILLYKELLNKEEQEYCEDNDVPYHGDDLLFTGENKSGALTFENHGYSTSGVKKYVYTIKD